MRSWESPFTARSANEATRTKLRPPRRTAVAAPPGGEAAALVDLVRARGAPASSRYLLAGLDRLPPSAACLVAQVLARPGRPASLRPPERRPVKGWPQAINSVAGMPGTTVAQPRLGRRSWVTQGLNQGFLA